MGFPVHIEPLDETVEKKSFELVERKGKGHPDSLADGISESISQALSRAYLETFGIVAHYNTDEVQIVGGQSSPRFGGGTVEKPIFVLLAGRATNILNGKKIPVQDIAVNASRELLEKSVRYLNVGKNVQIECRIGAGSADLQHVFSRSEIPLANDTSFGIGHAPYSELESLVLGLENYITGSEFTNNYPAVGEDVKVMGARLGNKLNLTVATAFVDRHLNSLDEYSEAKSQVYDEVLNFLKSRTDKDIHLSLNAGDGSEVGSVYLTVTGTSAEMGDDGSTGRGNRVNGLITPCRPMSLEAASGKNPITHVGKLYNIAAHRSAQALVDEVPS